MQYLYEKRAKMVGNIDKGLLWLLNVHDDWIHDQYGESHIYYGTIYSSKGPFHPLSTTITGYFQDSDSSRWLKVKNGVARIHDENNQTAWKGQIDDFLKVTFKTGVYKSITNRSLLLNTHHYSSKTVSK
ncbi:molecular chaperone GrpE [Mesobacillus maritimus]|uniref:molecular chaperone GrpE n=1 Tax=Mesobacillus maritimus TaxID=1643336 RepID=UPI00384ED082